LTAASVAGDFGAAAQAVALQLLEQGVVSVLASDAHNLQHRQPNLEPGRAAAAQVLGEDASWRLVRDMPMSLVASQFQQFQFQQ
jgi:protein-tyrosine phosphatase